MKTLNVLALASLALAACRPDPGQADYSTHADLRARNAPPEFLVGPTPFVPGTERWSVGFGYEGPASTTVNIDGVSSNFFIFDTNNDGTGTFTYIVEGSDDRVEGSRSDRFVHGGLGFAGAGIFWSTARDVSELSALHVSLKSSDGAFATVQLTVASGPDQPPDGTPDPAQTFIVDATAYGYSNNGEWHNLRIPFSDFQALGWDPFSVRSPIAIGAGGGNTGEILLVDNIFLE